MNVVVDDVLRRRRDVWRRAVIYRHRHVIGDRQDKRREDGGRWRQHDEVRWRRRQEKDRWRRWRREIVIRIVKNKHRLTEIHHLVLGRRRHIIADCRKGRRRLECRGEIREAAMGVGDMRAARIAAQIRPIGLRRIYIPRVPPGDRFPARGDDGANPSRHRVVGIGGEEVEIAS